MYNFLPHASNQHMKRTSDLLLPNSELVCHLHNFKRSWTHLYINIIKNLVATCWIQAWGYTTKSLDIVVVSESSICAEENSTDKPGTIPWFGKWHCIRKGLVDICFSTDPKCWLCWKSPRYAGIVIAAIYLYFHTDQWEGQMWKMRFSQAVRKNKKNQKKPGSTLVKKNYHFNLTKCCQNTAGIQSVIF